MPVVQATMLLNASAITEQKKDGDEIDFAETVVGHRSFLILTITIAMRLVTVITMGVWKTRIANSE